MQHERADSRLHTDRALIAALLKGEEAAFRTFFDSYFPRVHRFALRRLGGDVEAAKDVVQSSLIRAIRNLEDFRGDAALFSWICQICRRQVVDHLRANKRHADHFERIHDSVQLRAAIEAVEAPDNDEPVHRFNVSQTRQLVQSVLESLPSRHADVLRQKYIEECSVAEIGESLGIGHAAVQSILARARAGFRAALERMSGSTAKDILQGMSLEAGRKKSA